MTISHMSVDGDAGARVTVRRLPAGSGDSEPDHPGEALRGQVRQREDMRLEVELDPIAPAGVISPGDLVEVRTPRFLYLGQIRAIRGTRLTIMLEHSIELEPLESIQRLWNRAHV